MTDPYTPSCPLPLSGHDRVILAHGAGGRAMGRLIRDVFVRAFDDPALRDAHDGAEVEATGRIALTTDAFTVKPLWFPGGDIGSLAIYGTVNDLAMCGARPRWLTAAFVLEEGLPLDELRRLVDSMAAAARACGVRVVTGDTKVVERGHGDGLYVTTTGVGEVIAPRPVLPAAVRPGDAVIVSGPVGEHGVAVMLARADLGLATPVESDAASVVGPSLALFEAGVDVHCLRDPTRGGLAAVLAEIAETAGVCVHLDEASIPVRPEVADACELLGLDPLHVASEGRFVAFVPGADADRAMAAMREHGAAPVRIGEVVEGPAGTVLVQGPFGGERILDVPEGEALPRIC